MENPPFFFDDLLHPQFFQETKDKHEGNGQVNQFDYHHQTKKTHTYPIQHVTVVFFSSLYLLVRWLEKNKTYSPKLVVKNGDLQR